MKSKILAIWMCAMLVSGGAVVMIGNGAEAAAVGERPAFSGTGSGTPGDPYVILTVEQLQEMNLDLAAHYKLGQNINAAFTYNWNYNVDHYEGFVPVGTSSGGFTGSLDGKGFTIMRLYINRPSTDNVGLFGWVSSGASITDVRMVGGSVTGSYRIGGLVGCNLGSVTNSFSGVPVSGGNIAGGLVGTNAAGGYIANCYATGAISGSGRWIGGLVGYNYGSVWTSYAHGSVTAAINNAGGLVGANEGGVHASYSTGAVTGAISGGLIGYNTNIADTCYWDTETSGWATSAGGTGKTTAEMKTQSTFGWDFTNTWHMYQTMTYPMFQWQTLPICGGDGSSGNPYQIQTAEGLQLMETKLTAHYALACDINAYWTAFWNSDAGFRPVGPDSGTYFAGSLNGNNHTVSYLYINRPGTNMVGLFGHSRGAVRNLNMASVNIQGQENTGGLCGYAYDGIFTNCHVSGGQVIGTVQTGGIVGQANHIAITGCSYSGIVIGTNRAGGIAGGTWDCVISKSFSTASVSAGYNPGGLIGINVVSMWNLGYVNDSFATGTVTGGQETGGLVGNNYGRLARCFSSGAVSGSFPTGGMIGASTGTETGCFWDTQSSGQATSAGAGAGKTTAEMRNMFMFVNAGWDFINVWDIDIQQSYPFMRTTAAYTIHDVSDLQTMNLDLNGDWTVANGFDASITATWNGGEGFDPIGNATMTPFTGSFDGQNFTITGLFINRAGGLKGLFGTIDAGAKVTNVTLQGFNITASANYAGALAGVNKGTVRWVNSHADVRASTNAGGLLGTNDPSSSLSDCHSAGTVTTIQNNAGGLVGYTNGHVTNCSSSANVTAGTNYAGGLAGQCDGASLHIADCHASGTVKGGNWVGGLVGENLDSIITQSSASGLVISTGSDVGGLIGASGGSVSHCSASGNLSGGSGTVGGLVGNNGGTVTDSDASGTLSAPATNSVGGLAGYNGGTVSRCHSTGNVTGQHYVGGLVASNAGSIDNCSAAGTTVGGNYVGGLVGLNHNGFSVAYSFSTGNASGVLDVGGLVGTNVGSIDRCHSIGNAEGTGNNIGGLAGNSNGVITNAYARGTASGDESIGSLVGNNDGFISYSYGTGQVTGNLNFGGLVGWNTNVVLDSYYDSNTTGLSDAGKGAPKTTAEMMQQATFAGWDFTNIWDIKETYTYPFFLWEQFDSAPIAVNDNYTTDEDTLFMGNLTANDLDPDGDALTVIALNGIYLDLILVDNSTMLPSGAVLTLYANGTFIYNPNGQFEFLNTGGKVQEAFTYHIADSNDSYDDGFVWINVTGVNDPPVISNAGGTVPFNEGGPPVTIDPDITVNDPDSANITGAWVNITAGYQNIRDFLNFTDTATITGVYNAPNLILTGTDTIANYTAALRSVQFYNGWKNPTLAPRTITWTATDGQLTSAGVTSTVTINDVNDPPVAVNDTGATDEDTAFDTADVTLNDTDPELDTLNVASLDDAGTFGIVTDNGDNTFNYDPNSQFEYLGNGDVAYDFFNYTVSDGNGGTDVGMVTVTVNGVNDAPVLGAIGNQTVNEGVALAFTATATDPETDGLAFSLEAGYPTGASIDPATGEFTWTPTEAQGPGFYNITIRVTDNGTPNRFDSETIMVTVGEVNLAPVLDSIGPKSVNEETLLSFKAWANDTDNPANTLAFSLDAGAPAGASIDPVTGDFTWTPTETQGPNTYFITIRVTDNGVPALDDSETVQIDVAEVNLAPVLGTIGNRVTDEMALLTFTATATDADLPANALTFTLQGTVPAGAAITAGGLFTWAPTEAQGPGFYNITVCVSDGTLFDEETFMVTVGEVNIPPTAVNDAITVSEDSGPNAVPVLANDIDPDIPANVLAVTAVTQGAHGTVTITGGGSGLEYAPDPDYFGTDTFTYTMTDGSGQTSTATVTVTVVNVNDPPTAGDDAATVQEDSGANAILVLANDGFAPDAGETLTVTAITQGAHGSVAIAAGGAHVIYTPRANFHGTDTFTYTVSDGNGGTATATVTVLVTNVNDPPVITTSDVTAGVAGVEYSVDYAAADADGDTLTWSLVTTAGWLSIDPATGLLNGTAEAGTFTVQVTVSDGNGGTATAFFTLAVSESDTDGDGVPDAGDAFPDDPNEWVDTDSDGIGNNADTDDDGDGVSDTEDAFPLDSSESVDTDGNGIGNNADPDDDGDGVPDTEDPEPLNPAITGNEYDGGWPYWPVVISILVALVIALICLGIVRWLLRKN